MFNRFEETDMSTAVLNAQILVHPAHAAGRTATALRSLMQAWEQEAAPDEEESEAELMVLMSGMVSPDAMRLDGE